MTCNMHSIILTRVFPFFFLVLLYHQNTLSLRPSRSEACMCCDHWSFVRKECAPCLSQNVPYRLVKLIHSGDMIHCRRARSSEKSEQTHRHPTCVLTSCSEKEIDEIGNIYCVGIIHTCTIHNILRNRGGKLFHYYEHVRVYYIV